MKKIAKFYLIIMIIMVMMIFYSVEVSNGKLASGESAPFFSLDDLQGERYDLSSVKETPMVVLYFFDIESRPSQEGLLTLNELIKRYRDIDFKVWAITLSAKDKVADFAGRSGLDFPVLLDNSDVSDNYQARLILPTVCIVGPGLKVLDYFQGGGKHTEVMLVRLAERELQRKQTQLAKAISEEVVKKNPQNVKAEVVKGYAALKEGNMKEAEEVFREMSSRGDQGSVLGKEGMAAVYAQKGQPEKALEFIGEVEKTAPERGYVHSLRGDIYYAQGKREEAESAYRNAVLKKDVEIYQQPVIYNRLGRVQAELGRYESAREFYDKAVTIDPYYIEATTNKGVTYEREGKWGDAMNAYQYALSINKEDTFASVLAKKAQEMLELNKDTERKKRIENLVKTLADRYRTQKYAATEEEKDSWTSRPMILSFVDFQERGALSERDGLSSIMTTELTDYLNSSGRVKVVERVLIERLLDELNLGSSELADPETTLKLGKVLAAKLIGTGSLFNFSNGTLLSFRIIDTETSGIAKVITRQLNPYTTLREELFRLNREILGMVVSQYPLQGYVVEVTDENQAIINIGLNHGVVLGTRFDVLEDVKPIKYKGKLLKMSGKSIGQMEVVQVEPDLSFARVIEKKRGFRKDDKVREKMEEAVVEEKDVY